MTNIENYPQGYWKVGAEKFISKYQALLKSTESGTPIKYHYFDHIWDSLDRQKWLGKFTLNELYRQRAQQLRDSYDYLILYFSGGADSYNILRTFIDNGIHLDEICVKWCPDTVDNGIYKPNTSDTSTYNYLSEWDYAIKPVLDEISRSHPEIKIEIVNWFNKDIGDDDFFRTFELVNHWHDIEVPSLAVWSPNEEKLILSGRTVGSIYGVDKPITYFDGSDWFMTFSDSAIAIGTPNPANVSGIEYFYWTPKMPLLAYEQAHCAIKEAKRNADFLKMCYTVDLRGRENLNELTVQIYQYQQTELRSILYTNWTNRFQVQKSTVADRSDKQMWLDRHTETKTYRDRFRGVLSEHRNQISPNIANSITNIYNIVRTKLFWVCKN